MNTVSFDGGAVPEVSQDNDDIDSLLGSNSSPPAPPLLNRNTNQNVSGVQPDTPGRTTANTSIFVPPSSSRYLSAPRISYDTSTKCVIPKDARPTKQADLRKLRDAAVMPLDNQIGLSMKVTASDI